MKKRIFSIMDTSKKRAGAIVLIATLLLTFGTGAAFAVNAAAENVPDNTTVTSGAISDENYTDTPVTWEPSPEYEQFGISYDGNGKMLFNGQVVRYFWDGYHVDSNSTATHYDYLNEDGVIDVHTIRSVTDYGDGSFNPFDELLDIVAYSQEEFEARDIDLLKRIGSGSVTAAINGSGSDSGEGRTIAQVFSDYKDYGITYVEDSENKAIGNVYYQGQLVKTLIDNNPSGGLFTFSSTDGGNITVRTVYDANGNLTGVKVDN